MPFAFVIIKNLSTPVKYRAFESTQEMFYTRARNRQCETLDDKYSQFRIPFEEIISLPRTPAQLGDADDNRERLDTIKNEALLRDGFLFYTSQITSIRNTIRSNIEQEVTPIVDYPILHGAAEIDVGIREWRPPSPGDSLGDLINLLYKQALWMYLWQTIYPLKYTSWVPEQKIISSVKDGLALLERFPHKDPIQELLLMPAFIFGCGAFDPAERDSIKSSIDTMKEYCSLENIVLALEVLEQLWKYMDQKDERSWDWQSIANRIRIDSRAD